MKIKPAITEIPGLLIMGQHFTVDGSNNTFRIKPMEHEGTFIGYELFHRTGMQDVKFKNHIGYLLCDRLHIIIYSDTIAATADYLFTNMWFWL